MRCPKCGQDTSGNYCNNCGASLMEEDYLLEENLAESLKDLFEDTDSWEPETKPDNREENRTGGQIGSSRREENRRAERNYVAKKADEGPLRAPRSRKDPKEQKKSTSEKKEKPVKSEKKKEETGRSRRSDRENRENKYSERERRTREPASRRRETERVYREDGERSESGESAFQTAKNAAVKGAVGTIIISSRVMQIISAFLMALMTIRMARTFYDFGSGLGLIDTMLTDRNYGLILYVGMAGFSLFMGVVWCLWILSKKAAGGQVRLKKYDVGRGFFPFLICLAVVFGAGVAVLWVPSEAESLKGMAGGMTALLAAVNGQRGFLFSCSAVGAVLSLVRKLLRV